MSKTVKSDFISVSIDLGSDSTKAAYCYVDENGNYVSDLLFKKGDGLPSMAYYDSLKEEWIFDKKEILSRAESSFRYLVKVKDLLDLFPTRASDELYNNNFFKNYYYPPKENDSYTEAIEKNRFFRANKTAREVCSLFVSYCVGEIKKEIKNRFGDVKIRYVVVYPANAEKEYIDELVHFVTSAAGTEDVFIISAPRAVGISAKEYDVVGKKKNVLLFNVGEEEISVVKVRFDENNICVFGPEGHNSPERIGGRNIDIALAGYLFEKSSSISAFGDQMSGGVEQGAFFNQFRMQQGVKAGKKVFSDGKAYQRLGGFVFSVYREMITSVKVTQEEFVRCCEPVFEKIWDYVSSELDNPENSDVRAVIFSGGAADTFGLDKYIEEKLADDYPKVSFIDFSPENKATGYDDILIAAKDTVPVGAALYGAGKYKFTILTSFSYGTWLSKKINGRRQYLYSEFVRKNTEIAVSGRPDFKIVLTSGKQTSGEPIFKRGKYLIHNEYYKSNIGSYRVGSVIREYCNKKDDMVIFDEYVPKQEFRSGPTGKVKFTGTAYLNGSDEVPVNFSVIGYYLLIYRFPKNYSGDKDEVVSNVYFQEGFEVDCEGRVTPIVQNVSEEYYYDHHLMKKYDPIYQQIELVLEPNGTTSMDINN